MRDTAPNNLLHRLRQELGRRDGPGGRRARGIRPVALLLALALAVPAAPALAQQPGQQQQQQQQQMNQQGQGIIIPQLTTVDRVMDNPVAYLGRPIAIAGQIDDVLSNRSFSADDRDPLFQEEMLVFGTRTLPGLQVQPFFGQGLFNEFQPAFAPTIGENATFTEDGFAEVTAADLRQVLEGDWFVATGTMRIFNTVAFENELGVDLDDQVFADFEGRPALMATGLTLQTPTLEEITEFPLVYQGRFVTVHGQLSNDLGDVGAIGEGLQAIGPFNLGTVEAPFELRGFTISQEGEGGVFGGADQLRVLSVNPPVQPTQNLGFSPVGFGEGATVIASGEVRRFSLAEFERELGADLDDQVFADWEGQAVLLATQITLRPDDLGLGD